MLIYKKPLIYIITLLLLAFLYFIFPTIYTRYEENSNKYRVNRFNDCKQVLYEGRWHYYQLFDFTDAPDKCLTSQEKDKKMEQIRLAELERKRVALEEQEAQKREPVYNSAKIVLVIPSLSATAKVGENMIGQKGIFVEIYNPTDCIITNPKITVEESSGSKEYSDSSFSSPKKLLPKTKEVFIYETLMTDDVSNGNFRWYISDIDYSSDKGKDFDYSCITDSAVEIKPGDQ